ncbi:MAG: PAS domain S-box protein [Spirochaetota bacterium]|nr:PAS domain S-box protein [Spirochaetota bacterium]
MVTKEIHTPNILIVTVDPGICNIIEVLLNNLNYKIQLTNSGTEAIEQLREKNYDLILLDVNLTDMNVLQVLSFAKDQTPNSLIIILTGDSSFDKTIECLNQGAYDYIQKPFEKEEIHRRVENALAQKDMEKELKKMKERLEASEKRYHNMIQESQDIIYTLDYEGKFTFINDSSKDILGYDYHQLLGKHYSTIIYPDDLEKAKHAFHERRTINRKAQRNMLRIMTYGDDDSSIKLKQLITIEFKAKGVYDRSVDRKEKLFLGTYGVARNISGHIQIQKALRLQKAYYRQLFNNLQEAIVILDNADRIIDASQSFVNLFKYSLRELKGCNITDLIVPDGLVNEAKSLSRSSHSMKIVRKETSRKSKDGSQFNVLIFNHPITFENKQIGVYGIYKNLTPLRSFENRLGNTMEKLRKATGGIIHAMVSTVEVRDPYTAGHQQRVADLARAIAKEMGVPKCEIDSVSMAGTLHDLGKVNIPAEILSKPGCLADIEFNLIKMHPEIGYHILKEIDLPWPIAEIVYQHHERIDGSGYPKGLKGNKILLAGKILTVADVVEAIASHRPYRPALGIDKALNEISRYRGVYYDPKAVDACIKLFVEKRFTFANDINKDKSSLLNLQDSFWEPRKASIAEAALPKSNKNKNIIYNMQ